MAVCYVSAYHGGSRLKDGMQQLSYSEIYPTLGEKKKINLKIKLNIQRKKYQQLA